MVTFETDIILVVNVPVLSLQITVVQPRVSTDGKERTMAFKRAMRFVPRAKHLEYIKIYRKQTFRNQDYNLR